MSPEPVAITRMETRRDNIQQSLEALQSRLSPRGDVISQSSRERTTAVFGEPLAPRQVVQRICDEVRDKGLAAVLRYGQLLDGVELDAQTLQVSKQQLAAAHQAADPRFLETIRRIRDNILDFQQAILHQSVTVERDHGVTLQQRYLPMRRAGLCIPGGAAAYPSSLLMTAVPAIAAGVPEIAVVAPPTDFGANNQDLLATCHELGIGEVYRVGGAQAVAALAYGNECMPAVDIVVGPGNQFVALAKQYVFGDVAIDSIAGPSEVVVIADATSRPDFVAADLLAQAEHAPGASMLVTWSEKLLEETEQQLQRQLQSLSREDVTRQSLEEFAALILTRDAAEACQITNLIAPEHLHIAVDDPQPLLDQIQNAGAIFLGTYSPVAVGDYVAGPSHVLPTGGTARWASGLTANDFLRSGSVIGYDQSALRRAAADVQMMADKEGLSAHRASIDIRL